MSFRLYFRTLSNIPNYKYIMIKICWKKKKKKVNQVHVTVHVDLCPGASSILSLLLTLVITLVSSSKIYLSIKEKSNICY